MKKVSVIVCVYNSEDYLNRCIDSILNQTYGNLELIIINDGSTDNSEKIISSYKDKRIKLFNQKNTGVGLARNKGLSLVTGYYILFIDSDDYVEKTYLEEMINALESSNSDVVCSTYNNATTYYTKIMDQKEALLEMVKLPPTMDVSLCNKIIKRKVIKSITFNNLKVAEDMLFLGEALLQSNKILFINKKYYFYTVNDSSLCRKQYDIRYNDKIIASYKLFEIVSKKYKNLHDKFYIYYLFNYIGVLNKMILSNYEDKRFIKTLKIIIKKNYDLVMSSDYPRIKKNQYRILNFSYNLYKIIYKVIFKLKM